MNSLLFESMSNKSQTEWLIIITIIIIIIIRIHFENVRKTSMIYHGPIAPPDFRQQNWDEPAITKVLNALNQLPDPAHKARILTCQAPHAGNWLLACPI